MRTGSRGRITLALLGLIVLVLAGWFVRERVADEPPAPPPPVLTTTTTAASPS